MEAKRESNIMPYDPRPGATVNEILFDPRNTAITFIAAGSVPGSWSSC